MMTVHTYTQHVAIEVIHTLYWLDNIHELIFSRLFSKCTFARVLSVTKKKRTENRNKQQSKRQNNKPLKNKRATITRVLQLNKRKYPSCNGTNSSRVCKMCVGLLDVSFVGGYYKKNKCKTKAKTTKKKRKILVRVEYDAGDWMASPLTLFLGS
jgi:hypothetical protein